MFSQSESLTKKNLMLLLIIVVFPALSMLFLEGIHRGGITNFLKWPFEQAYTFMLTYFFLLALTGIFYFLPKKYFMITLLLQIIFWSAIAFTSFTKFQLRGEYFTPFDLYLVKEGLDISRYINGIFSIKLLFPFIILIPYFYFLAKINDNLPFKKRVLISLSSLLIFIIIVANPTLFSKGEKLSNIDKYMKFGFIGGFLTIMDSADSNTISYTEADVDKIVNNLQKDIPAGSVDPNFKPNVIVVLAEALWDPQQLNNVTFKEDPIPYFRSLMANYPSGNMISHSFGGGTINPEMEILTGLSTRFVPEETYNSYITRPIDSLAHVFRQQGYHTTAVHSFKNWFYNRRESYKYLGFERFVSLEYFNNPKYIGPFIDDRILMRRALDEAKNTDGPDFMNIVTVTSHGPYNDTRYDQLPEMTESTLTDSSKYILNLYTQLLTELDASIKELIEGVQELDEPTIVAIYGDHLPMLGDNFAVYKETGYLKGDIDTFKNHNKMYSTPIVIWDNFSTPVKKENLRLSANFVGSYLLTLAKKEQSPIFLANQNLYNQGITVIPVDKYYENEGIDIKKLYRYQILQHDTLYGEQYLYKSNPVKPSNTYLLGSGPMKINDVEIARSKNGAYEMNLQGENFVAGAKLFINDTENEFNYINSTTIQAKISNKPIKNNSDLEIVLKIIDDQGTVITETNLMKTTIK